MEQQEILGLLTGLRLVLTTFAGRAGEIQGFVQQHDWEALADSPELLGELLKRSVSMWYDLRNHNDFKGLDKLMYLAEDARCRAGHRAMARKLSERDLALEIARTEVVVQRNRNVWTDDQPKLEEYRSILEAKNRKGGVTG